ncbi:MAG: site-specific integrase [Candidatus Marinimicrobia bacterium]|nr:site-specific integrase [Candidatus Neomarinimicrobiota bacterium]
MSSLYKRPDSKYYWWTICYKGRRLRKSTQMKRRDLAKKVQEYWDLKLIKDDLEFLGISTLPGATYSEYIQHYLQFIETRKSIDTISVTTGVLKRFQQYLDLKKVKRLDEITVPLTDGYIDWLSCAPKTRKNHVNVIAIMLDQAIKEGVLTTNPVRKATLPKITQVVKHRLLNLEDVKVIFEGAGSWKLYYLYLYHTGLRAGDAGMLTYGNVNRKKGIITNYIRKSRRIHEFPLSDLLINATPKGKKDEPLFPLLYSLRRNEKGKSVIDERNLHYRLSKPREYLQAILHVAERPKATLHSFRVTYNNSLRDLGLSIEDRQILLAHSSSQTTQVYTHPNIQLAREYVNRLPNPLQK